MAVVNSIKAPIKSYRGRTLYKVEETYSNGMVYHGYYVENSSDTSKKGQAYRFKTVNGNEEKIEDAKALDKAKNTLMNGFPF